MKTSAYTPFEVQTRDRIVGLFVIGAVLLFLIGILIPAIQRLTGDEGIPFFTILDQTYGIVSAAKVSLSGVDIGNVKEVSITEDGQVRVDIILSSKYAQFYTNKSRLTVDTNISASTILSGSGLILEPGNEANGLMEPGSLIRIETPQRFGSILEEIDLVALTDQITGIVDNIDSITTGLAENQNKIYASFDNLQEVTQSLAEVSKSLPAMVSAIDSSLVALRESLAGINELVGHTDEDLQETLKNAVALTAQATSTLAQAEKLFERTTPVMDQLPSVLITTDVALKSLTQLSDQLGNWWLLGGGNGRPAKEPPGPTAHPHDDSLYELEGVQAISSND